MRAEYTIRASVIYEIRVMADDEDEAVELAGRIAWSSWREVDAEYFIQDVEPVTKEARHVDD